MIEDDTHDKLIKAYLNYFKANEIFTQRPAELKRRNARRYLSEIAKLCKIRRDEIMKEHIDKVEDGRKNNMTPRAIASRQKREQEAQDDNN